MSNQPTPETAPTSIDLSQVPLDALLREVRTRPEVASVTIFSPDDARDAGYEPDSIAWSHVEDACARAGFEAMEVLGDPLDEGDEDDNEDDDQQ